MYCSNCGKELPAGSKFCPGCGTAIRPLPRSNAETVPPVSASTPSDTTSTSDSAPSTQSADPSAQPVTASTQTTTEPAPSITESAPTAAESASSVSEAEEPLSNPAASVTEPEKPAAKPAPSITAPEQPAAEPVTSTGEFSSTPHIPLGLFGLLLMAGSTFLPIFHISILDVEVSYSNWWEFISLGNSIGSMDATFLFGVFFLLFVLAIAVWSGSSTRHRVREVLGLAITLYLTYVFYLVVMRTADGKVIDSVGPAFYVALLGDAFVIVGGIMSLFHSEPPIIVTPSSSGSTLILIGTLIMVGSLFAPLYEIPLAGTSCNYFSYYKLCDELNSSSAVFSMIFLAVPILTALFQLHTYSKKNCTRVQLVAGAFIVVLLVIPLYLYVHGKTESFLGLASLAMELGISIYITFAGAAVVLLGSLLYDADN